MFMRTRQEHSKTKEKILKTAEQLMLAQGYAATSIEKICKAAKLTKGSFFHYFKNKEDLGKTLVERFCCSSQEKIQQVCCKESGQDPLARVYLYIDSVIEGKAGKGGCLIGTFAQELSDTHPHIRSCCAKGFEEWAEVLRKDLTQAKAKYAPKLSVDGQSLAEYLIAVFEGAQILARAKKDPRVVRESMQHAKRYLRSLFGR